MTVASPCNALCHVPVHIHSTPSKIFKTKMIIFRNFMVFCVGLPVINVNNPGEVLQIRFLYDKNEQKIKFSY